MAFYPTPFRETAKRILQDSKRCILLPPEGQKLIPEISSAERPMDSKKPNRRRFLKGGAAVAGLAAGAVRSASGQTPEARPPKGQGADRLWRALPFRDLDTRAGRETFARCLWAYVSRSDSACGVGRDYHAILAPLCGCPPWLLCSGHRSQGASSHDPRDGGSSVDFHHGRVEAPPFGNPRSFSRVHWKPFETHA